MQLRVFLDDRQGLQLEVSSPSLAYDRKLFVPMFLSEDPGLEGIDSNALVEVLFQSRSYKVPYMLVHSRQMSRRNWRELGSIEDGDSRNVLNHILDILAWD